MKDRKQEGKTTLEDEKKTSDRRDTFPCVNSHGNMPQVGGTFDKVQKVTRKDVTSATTQR